MATDAERLVINIDARLNKFEAAMNKAAGIANKQFGAIEKQAAKTQKKLNGFGAGGLGGLTKGLGFLSAGLLGAQGARAIADYASQYVGLQNALKVTGLEGKALGDVFAQLTQVSLKQGAPLDALVQLYSRVSQSAGELHASQSDLIKFSDGVAVSLRVAGTSATEAQGALLQLSQALGSGVVRAEEFNSVNEGARPILQAVANGLEEAGGSVSKLRTLVLAGKVSSEAFFKAGLAGFPSIAAAADKAQGTVGQATERVNTAMTVFVGKLDEATGGSKNAAEAINAVATAIEALPGYIDAAVKGLDELQTYINKLDKSSFFGQLRDALRYNPEDPSTHPNAIPPSIIRQILPPRSLSLPIQPQPGGAGRFRTIGGAGYLGTDGQGGAGAKGIANVLDVRGIKVTADALATAGTSATAMAGASGGATVSIHDFAAAAANAAGKLSAIDTEIAGVTGGAVGDYTNDVVKAEYGDGSVYKNPNSSASGAGQFVKDTWLALFKKNFPEIAKGMADPEILELRRSRAYSTKLIEAYAAENAAVLTKAGLSVDQAALHLSHFLGAGDAVKVLKAAPGTPLQGLVQQSSINANPTILGGGRTVDDAIAYANKRAGNTRRAAGNFTPAEEAATAKAKSYQDLVAGSVEYIASQDAEAKAIGKTAFEAAKLQHAQDLLNQASQAGLEITPALKAQIDQLATGMANAEIAASGLATANKMSVERLDEFRDGARDVLGGFISDLKEGKSASEALGNALASIGDKLLDSGINSLIDGLLGKSGTSGGGLFGSLFSAFGFASGGYTGSGSRNTPAGIVHKGEYVVPKNVVDKIGVGNIQRMYGGYANGGFVTGVPVSTRAPNMRSVAANQNGGPRTIAVDVTGANGDKQIREMVAQGVRAGISQYDKKLDTSIGSKLARNQART